MNEFLETVKLIAETVTTLSTAVIVSRHIKTIKVFFLGTYTLDGKKVRFCKAVKEAKKQKERIRNIVNAIAPNREDEYLLNKEKLEKLLFESGILTKVSRSRE